MGDVIQLSNKEFNTDWRLASGVAFSMLRNIEEAEDVASRSLNHFYDIVKSGKKIKNRKNFISYLTRLKAIDRIREKDRERKYIQAYHEIHPQESAENPFTILLKHEIPTWFHTIMTRLKDASEASKWKVFYLRYFEGLKLKEIEPLSQLSKATISNYVNEVLEKLITMIHRDEECPLATPEHEILIHTLRNLLEENHE